MLAIWNEEKEKVVLNVKTHVYNEYNQQKVNYNKNNGVLAKWSNFETFKKNYFLIEYLTK